MHFHYSGAFAFRGKTIGNIYVFSLTTAFLETVIFIKEQFDSTYESTLT